MPSGTEGQEISTLRELVDRIDKLAEDKGYVTLGEIVEAVGRRSFGPLLLLAGVIMASPIASVPGMPSCMGVIVLLIASQLLLRKEHFWLPRWVLDRSASSGSIYRALRHLRAPASFVDSFVKPRLPALTQGPGNYLIAIICVFIAFTMPMMEVVPFSIHGAGFALTAFGLALIARDGLFGVVAFLVTAVTYGFAIYRIFF